MMNSLRKNKECNMKLLKEIGTKLGWYDSSDKSRKNVKLIAQPLSIRNGIVNLVPF